MRFVALLLLAVANAQQVLFTFSGNFSTLRQKLTPNEYDYNGACGLASSQYYYTTFNYTFASAGVRGIYGANLIYVGVSQDMTGFTPLNLCANTAVYPLKQTAVGFSAGTGPEYSFAGWFDAGMYTFVIAGNGAPFAGEIKEAQIKGTTSSANAWEPFQSNAGSTACQDSSTASYFDAKLYTATRTGYHSLFLAFAQNKTDSTGYQLPSGYAVLTVLKGDYTASVSSLKCASVGSNYTLGRHGDSQALNVQMFNAMLQTGVTYTIIVSGGDVYQGQGFVGSYGIHIFGGTKYDFSSTNDVYTRPASDSCTIPSQCMAAYNEPQGNNYARITFTVPKNSYYWVHSQTNPNALYLWYFYNENNVNKSTCGTNFNCVGVESFLPGTFFFSGNSENFTIYATGAVDQQVFSEGYVDFYILGGASLTAVPTSAPTAAPSKAPTAAPNTVQPTTAGTTYAPTTKQPTVAPTTPQPTTPGTTYAPTSKQPTVAGTTLEPTAAGPEVSSAIAASMALSLCIGMLVLA